MKISAIEKLEASAILSNPAGFSIPPFQRPYKWDTNQTRTLVRDLWNALGRLTPSNHDDKFFLGTLIIRQPPSPARHEIVDGQQRLVTLFLIIAVIYELTGEGSLMSSLYTDPIKKIVRIELRAKAGSSQPQSSVVFADSYVDSTFLEQLLQGHPDSSQTNTIRANYEAIRSELFSFQRDKDVLIRLGYFIANHVQFVRVQVASLEDAYVAFEVLNSRSTPLSVHELIRSFLLTQGGTLAETAWSQVETLSSKIIDKGQMTQERYTCEVQEHSWLLTFGRYITMGSGGGANVTSVRQLFSTAREDLQSRSDAVQAVSQTMSAIAQAVFDLFIQKNELQRSDYGLLSALRVTGIYAPAGFATLSVLNARFGGNVSADVVHRLTAVVMRAYILNRRKASRPLRIAAQLEIAARHFFGVSGSTSELREVILAYSWVPELYSNEDCSAAWEEFTITEQSVARYVLLAIEQKHDPDGVYLARQRFDKDALEAALLRLSGPRPADGLASIRSRANQLSYLVGNWVLVRRDQGVVVVPGGDIVDIVSQRHKLLMEQAMLLWSLLPVSLSLPPGRKKHPIPF